MKLFALMALSTLAALSMTACNISVPESSKTANSDLIVTEKAYTDYTADLTDSEARLEKVGRRFVSAPDSSGRMVERFDENFYAQFRQGNPNPTAREELTILSKENAEFDTYMGRAKLFVNAYPEKIVIEKPDGSVSPLNEQHAARRALANKRVSTVVEKKTEIAKSIERLEKELNPPTN